MWKWTNNAPYQVVRGGIVGVACRYLLYGHGGSFNHGGEALAKTTIALLRRISPGCHIILSTHFADQDRKMGVDADELIEYNRNGQTNEEVYAATLNCITPDTICLHLGGDNYCYRNWQRYAIVHERAIEQGAVSLLWSCSIDPDKMDAEMLQVLRTHHLITARESVTYRALTEQGLTNVVPVADIAFLLEPDPVELSLENFVAVNVSPLIVRKNPLLKVAFQNLINYLIGETDLNVMLVPHVIASVDNDCEILKQFLIADSKRIVMASECLTAAQYKYMIAQARFGVFARTHAAIAAYSSLVPTLAVGYSVKAKGIATDLEMKDYLIDVAEISQEQALLDVFLHLKNNELRVKEALTEQIPRYRQGTVNERALQLLCPVGGNRE